ncbi:MAG: acyltransferase, partial [Methylococcales bacterium]|nr:acyltransferase [Methylococcales bacterium]
MSESRRYYPALDGLRGFAAFAVLLYHLQDYFESSSFIQGSFLSVDLFFLMSGFVIATSYERSLVDGSRSFASFTWSRVIRLYPLYIIACCIGFSYFLIKHLIAVPDAPDGLELVTSIPPTLLILPWPTAAEWGFTPYPFAPSAWSLSFELWFNIAYAALVMRLSTRNLVAVAVVAFVLMAHQAYAHDSIDMGWGMDTMLGGAARFWFSFSVGIIACRLNVHKMRVSRFPLWAAAPSLLFVFLPHDGVFRGLMWIVFAFPLALVICAGFHG